MRQEPNSGGKTSEGFLGGGTATSRIRSIAVDRTVKGVKVRIEAEVRAASSTKKNALPRFP
jgi:hypothetical protein